MSRDWGENLFNRRPVFIYLLTGLFLLVSVGTGTLLWTLGTSSEANEEIISTQYIPLIKKEAAVFSRSAAALKDKNSGKRNLSTFYSLRAYPGAPPVIPHEDFSNPLDTGNSCLACHADGGYVAQLGTYAPVTPHPEYVNCRQCHVRRSSSAGSRFPAGVNTDFKSTKKPDKKQAFLTGGPPAIPHSLQLRENCLACHSGPASVKEIRTTHPERANCRQCHVPADLKISSVPEFTRTVQEITESKEDIK